MRWRRLLGLEPPPTTTQTEFTLAPLEEELLALLLADPPPRVGYGYGLSSLGAKQWTFQIPQGGEVTLCARGFFIEGQRIFASSDGAMRALNAQARKIHASQLLKEATARQHANAVKLNSSLEDVLHPPNAEPHSSSPESEQTP